MSRRRRAAVLIGLSIILGALAASNVSGREAALRRAVGPAIPVLVARTQLAAGARLEPRALAVRRVPARYAPAAAYRPEPGIPSMAVFRRELSGRLLEGARRRLGR